MAQKDRFYSARGGLGFFSSTLLRSCRNTNWGTELNVVLRGLVRCIQPLGTSPLTCAEYMVDPLFSPDAATVSMQAAFFGAIFDIANLSFAKTGSGQTQDRLQHRPLPAGLAPHQPFGGSGRASPGAGGSKRARMVVHDEASRRAGCREVRRSCEWRAGARARAGGVRWGRSILARSS